MVLGEPVEQRFAARDQRVDVDHVHHLGERVEIRQRQALGPRQYAAARREDAGPVMRPYFFRVSSAAAATPAPTIKAPLIAGCIDAWV